MRIKLTSLSFAYLITLSGFTTILPVEAQRLPKDSESCYAQLVREIRRADLGTCPSPRKTSINFPCRKWNHAIGRVGPATCNTMDLNATLWGEFVRARHNRKIIILEKENKEQRAADLAAGRIRAPGVPVTESYSRQQRGNENQRVLWHNASPAERAEIDRRRDRARATAMCRDIYTVGTKMYTIDHCTGEIWD